MKKIAIFGGTFNPVHTEHINIVKSAIKELQLDKLIVVLDNLPPHKEIIPAKNNDRLEMLKLAFCGIDKVEISDYEISKEGKSYTYQTVEYYKSIYPQDQLFFIVGGDMLKDFKNWKYPERILNAISLVAVNRENDNFDLVFEKKYFIEKFSSTFIVLDYKGKKISSTKIRALASLNIFPIDGLTEEVANYIKENKIYCDRYCEYIINNLPEKRRIHTAGVIVSAESKIKELGLSPEKVRLSALLHDCAKYQSINDYKDFVMPQDVPSPVCHAFLGAYIAKNVLGILDEEIIDAIRFHTSGKANMTTLGKLIFVADMVEENRVYDGVELLRQSFKGDLDQCFKLCLEEEMKHLIKKGQSIYIETINAYDYYVKRR